MNWAFVRQVGPMRWAVRYSLLHFQKSILKKDSYLNLPTGLTIRLPRHSGFSTEAYVTKGNVDWGAESILVQFADSKKDFLDIGAHIGYYSTYLAPRVRRVFAFEPNPRNHPGLKANAALASNVEVVPAAVSSYEGVARFFLSSGTATGSLEARDGPHVNVSVVSIDSFIESHPEIDVGLVKIDIEGHDFEALLGMQATIERFQPLILTECQFTPELADCCARQGYGIFGAVCDRRTLKQQFLEFTTSDFVQKWHKMLFLVPRRLHAAFEKKCSSNGVA